MLETINLFETATGRFTGSTVEFFDPPMCCPTGLCGPALDQTLLDVNEMIMDLKAEGAKVERYQMANQKTLWLQFFRNPVFNKYLIAFWVKSGLF